MRRTAAATKHADAKDRAAHDPKRQLVVIPWILSNAAVNQRQCQLGDWEQTAAGSYKSSFNAIT